MAAVMAVAPGRSSKKAICAGDCTRTSVKVAPSSPMQELQLEISYTSCLGCCLEFFVQCGQGQATAQGQLQIGRIIGRQTVRACQVEGVSPGPDRRLIVHGNRQGA